MSDFQTKETAEGTEILIWDIDVYQKNVKEKKQRFAKYALVILVLGLIGFVLSKFNPAILLLTVVFAGVIYAFGQPNSGEGINPIVDTKNRRIMNFENQWFDYPVDSELVLSRTFRKTTSRSSRSADSVTIDLNGSVDILSGNRQSGNSHTAYYMDWELSVRAPQGEEVVFADSNIASKQIKLFSPESYRIAFLAEKVAEIASLPLIDESGVEPIRREVGTTDLPLVETLKQERTVKAFDGEVPQAVDREFIVTEQGGMYKIRERDLNINGMMVFISAILLTFILTTLYLLSIIVTDSSDQTVILLTIMSIGIMDVMLLIAFVVFGNGIRTAVTVTVNSDMIEYEERGLFYKNTQLAMPLPQLEDMIIFKAFGSYGLELASDGFYFPMHGTFDENEVRQLKDMIQQLIITV